MEIKRDYYLNKMISKMNNHLVKVVAGIRRCGKSYLMNTIFYNYLLSIGVKYDHIIKFAFDNVEDVAKLGQDLIKLNNKKKKVSANKFISYIKTLMVDNNTYYLLLDEIQGLEGFEFVLNGYLRMDNIDVYVSGSNAKFLSNDIITEFAGNADVIDMRPCSFSEFYSVVGGNEYKALNDYMRYGGIPLVVLMDGTLNNKEEALINLYKLIYLKDIEIRHKIKNKNELDDLLNILSSNIGSLTNSEKLKNTFRSTSDSKITSATISKYIDYFKDCFLLEESIRYDVKGKKYTNTPKKYYFTDLGLRNAKINFRQEELTHLLENLVYNELRSRGFRVDVGVVVLNTLNSKKKSERKYLEIDFVVNQGSKKYYIQVAYTILDAAKRAQEVRPFVNTNDSFKKIIITYDQLTMGYDNNGIYTMNIIDFLLNPDSLDKI